MEEGSGGNRGFFAPVNDFPHRRRTDLCYDECMKRSPSVITAAFIFSLLVPAIGYLSFGIIPASIFLVGYLGGFILWMLSPDRAAFASVKIPYVVTLLLFIVHRIDEYVSHFQVTLSGITGVPVPAVASVPIVILLIGSVLAWILAPVLMRRGSAFGYYLMWTFFVSMGISELAHFIFPFFTGNGYGYFPGMASVLLLAPAAWFGMWRLSRKSI